MLHLSDIIVIKRTEEMRETSYLALQSAQQLACLTEDSQVEVVVIVSDADFARSRQTDADREVAH